MDPRVLFHAVTALAGGTDALIPLAQLADIAPEAHARAMRKYETAERRALARTRIPLIDREWTQVVFLSPIHPHAFWRRWRDITGEELPPCEFWQIPLSDVPRDAVVFERRTSIVGQSIDASEVSALDRDRYEASMTTTDANSAWLRQLASNGRRGAWFNRTPHIVTAGPVPLENAETLSWHDPPAWRGVSVPDAESAPGGGESS